MTCHQQRFDWWENLCLSPVFPLLPLCPSLQPHFHFPQLLHCHSPSIHQIPSDCLSWPCHLIFTSTCTAVSTFPHQPCSVYVPAYFHPFPARLSMLLIPLLSSHLNPNPNLNLCVYLICSCFFVFCFCVLTCCLLLTCSPVVGSSGSVPS